MSEIAATHSRESNRPPRSNWLGAVVLVMAVLLWILRDLVVLVGLSVLLAYALDPLVSMLERVRIARWTMARGMAAALVMLVVGGLVGVAGAWLAPQAGGELIRFVERVPGILTSLLAQLRNEAAAPLE